MPSTEKFRDYVLAQFKGELRVTTRKLPDAKLQLPYDGAKPMLRVAAEQIADNGLLVRLLDAMLPELPAAKKKK